jgi:hypothetical protein
VDGILLPTGWEPRLCFLRELSYEKSKASLEKCVSVIQMCKIVVVIFALYGLEILSATPKKAIHVFEGRLLRKIFGTKRNEATEG